MTTSFTINYDEKTTSSFIDGMAERNIPLRVFHFDCCWINPYIAQGTDVFRYLYVKIQYLPWAKMISCRIMNMQMPGGTIQTELEVNYTDKGVI